MELPEAVPVMTLPNAILFPQAMLPLYIFEPRYRAMLEDVLASHRMFCVALRKYGGKRETPSRVAGIGLIRASVQHKDGTSNLILQGLSRVELGKVLRYKPYRLQQVFPLQPVPADGSRAQMLTDQVLDLVSERLKLGFQLPIQLVKHVGDLKSEVGKTDQLATRSLREAVGQLAAMNDPDQLVDLVSCALLPHPIERQVILETIDVENRLQRLILFLAGEIQRERKRKKD
ncbi:MAG: hypothetical protein FJ404_04650 [Verrucomicrobia bacterium]|nr:hypothetical protein [Verrucomicrobiota bacterium]